MQPGRTAEKPNTYPGSRLSRVWLNKSVPTTPTTSRLLLHHHGIRRAPGLSSRDLIMTNPAVRDRGANFPRQNPLIGPMDAYFSGKR